MNRQAIPPAPPAASNRTAGHIPAGNPGEGMTERTLCIIKPDGVGNGHIGEIITRIEREGFTILGMKSARLDRATAEHFYEVHRGRPFFEDLCDMMSGDRVVLIALERENAVEHWRSVIGATDPAEAEEGTLRALYGVDKGKNTVHGSDSPENGMREVAVFFSERELIEQR